MSEDLRWQEVFFGGGRRRNEKAEGAHAADGRRGSEIWADPAVRRSDLAGRSTSADLPCGRKLGSAPEERHVYSSPSFSIFPPAPQGRYEVRSACVSPLRGSTRSCGLRLLSTWRSSGARRLLGPTVPMPRLWDATGAGFLLQLEGCGLRRPIAPNAGRLTRKGRRSAWVRTVSGRESDLQSGGWSRRSRPRDHPTSGPTV